jgi:SAM-dependent methyltransferase
MSISYYDIHAEAYVQQTVNVDMSPFYDRFLPLVPPGGSILDAGCGSGRDASAFRGKNFRVTAFDASSEMCKSASNALGKTVLQLKFQEIEWVNEFDGVWACASLLHVSSDALKECFSKLFRALKPGGVLYVSFKYGVGQRAVGERQFLDMNEESLNNVLNEDPEISSIETWVTEDIRPGRSDEAWLNAIIIKASDPDLPPKLKDQQ